MRWSMSPMQAWSWAKLLFALMHHAMDKFDPTITHLKKLEFAKASRNIAEAKIIALISSESSRWRLAMHQNVRKMWERPETRLKLKRSSITTEVRGKRALCKMIRIY